MGNNAVLQIMMPFNKYFAVEALRNYRPLKKKHKQQQNIITPKLDKHFCSQVVNYTVRTKVEDHEIIIMNVNTEVPQNGLNV